MSEVEATFVDPILAAQAVELLELDPSLFDVRMVGHPITGEPLIGQIPMDHIRARFGVLFGALLGAIMGLLAGALVAWAVGDVLTGNAVWLLVVAEVLFGALAGGLALSERGLWLAASTAWWPIQFIIDRWPITARDSPVIVSLRTSPHRLVRLMARLHQLGAKRVEVLDSLPELGLPPLGSSLRR